MNAEPIHLPTDQEAHAAQLAVDAVRPLATERRPATIRLRAPDGADEVEVTLPGEALHLLIRVLTHMANGHAVTVMPVQAELTSQQAADLLGVSRPYLVRLLEDGKLAFRRVGTHRRIRAADLMAYKAARDAERQRDLDELTAEAQALGLGY